MTALRPKSVYPVVTGILFRMLCIAILIAAVGLNVVTNPTQAQIGGPPLTVYADPTMAQPGQSVSFTVIASGAGSYVAITIDVPNDLAILQDVDCVHSTLFCERVSVDEGMNRLNVTAPGALPGPDGPRSSVQVTVAFSVIIPTTAVPGTQYEVVSSVAGLINILDPTSETDKQVSTTLEVLNASGQRVPPPPTPSPSPVPTIMPSGATMPDTVLIELGLDPRLTNASVHLVPGQQGVFNVYPGFRDISGSFTLTLILPGEMEIIEQPRCDTVLSETTCSPIDVSRDADGSIRIEFTGESVADDPMKLTFTAEVPSTVSIDTSSNIVGRYMVTEALTGETHESDKAVPILFVDDATQLATAQEEGTLRVTFERAGVLIQEAGGCVAIYNDDRWDYKYFVCDNDAVAPPVLNDLIWTILSDTSPTIGEIVVPVNTGTYYITADSLPAGFSLEPGNETGQATVTPEGTEYIFELASP